MKIGITGVGGFIGRTIAMLAIKQGHTVSGVEQSTDGCDLATRLGVNVYPGDVRDRSTLMHAFSGCNALIHTAAMVVEGGDWDTVRSVNVGGTVQVIATAKALKIPRVVHLSSVMVYGFQFPDGITEDGPLRGESNPYCQTKIESEAVVQASGEAVKTVIFRPGDVYGPGSVPWIIRPLRLAQRAPLLVPDRTSFINPLHVDHLAQACITASAPNSQAEGVYNLVDDVPITCFEYFTHLSNAVNQRTHVVPARLLRRLFRLNSSLPRRWALDISEDSIAFLQRPGRYDATRARVELGFRPNQEFHTALPAAIHAFLSDG